LRIGIIQSNYIPWRGYFDLISDVDLFVLYDDVQFSRGNWRNRNLIKTPTKPIWLTVPVKFSSKDKRKNIEDITIDFTQKWRQRHIKSIIQNYSKSPFFKKYSDGFFDLYYSDYSTISELNRILITWIMKQLKIATPVRLSAELNLTGRNTDRLICLLKEVGATTYLSGPTGKNYIDISEFKKAGIGLEFKTYNYEEYPQNFGDYLPNVSIIDLLFNCGEDSCSYIKSTTPNEVVL